MVAAFKMSTSMCVIQCTILAMQHYVNANQLLQENWIPKQQPWLAVAACYFSSSTEHKTPKHGWFEPKQVLHCLFPNSPTDTEMTCTSLFWHYQLIKKYTFSTFQTVSTNKSRKHDKTTIAYVSQIAIHFYKALVIF